MSKIYKIQTPLMTNDPNAMALAYDKKRKKDVFIPITEDLLKFMSGKPKAFAFAKINPVTQNLEIERPAPWQNW